MKRLLAILMTTFMLLGAQTVFGLAGDHDNQGSLDNGMIASAQSVVSQDKNANISCGLLGDTDSDQNIITVDGFNYQSNCTIVSSNNESEGASFNFSN